MLYLFLAILSSTLVSVIMRLSEKKMTSTMVMFMANYAVCACVALGYMTGGPMLPHAGGWGFAVILGVLGGGLFLGSFALLRLNIRKNGIVLSSVFMKLGVLVPIAIAVVFFREIPGWLQAVGFVIAVAAIIVINGSPDPERKMLSSGSFWLLALLVMGGLTDSVVNIYDKAGSPEWREQFLFLIFLSACMICLIYTAVRKETIRLADLLFGGLIGIPNYFSTRFLMLSLGQIKAIVAYPVYNVGSIVLITLAGVLIFREAVSRRKLAGIGLILISLVLLNL